MEGLTSRPTAHEAAAELRAIFAQVGRRQPGEYPPRVRAGMDALWARTPHGVLSGQRLDDQPAVVQDTVAALVVAVLEAADGVR